MLEVASELVALDDWRHKQARIDLRPQGADEWQVVLFASDGLDGITEVLAGRAHFAILNPATAIRSGIRRLTGSEELPIRAIATIPSYDQLGLAVDRRLGLETLEDLAAARPRLTLSLRGARPNHTVHSVLEDTLGAVGLHLSDFEEWGGTISYDEGLPHRGDRARALSEGEINAVFDEGVYNWVELAHESGLGFLSLGEGAIERMIESGYRRAVIKRARYPVLPRDVTTVDFSGFLVYTRSDTDAEVVHAFCSALDARADRIPWQGGRRLPLAQMVIDAVDAPLPMPLHPAAHTFWESKGYAPGGQRP